MSQGPTAFTLFRVGFARILDVTGVVLLTWLCVQVMFGESQPFQVRAFWVGFVAAASCVTAPGARRDLPIPMLAYTGIALTSAAVHYWQSATPVGAEWWMPFQPAFYLVIMCVFVAGTSHLLRTPLRLSVFVVLFVTAVSILTVQALYDRATFGFIFERYGNRTLPSVVQWVGLHQVGLVMVLGLPLTLSLTVVGRSVAEILSGALLSSALLLVAYINASASGVITMLVTTVLMLAVKAHRVRRGWLTRLFYALAMTVFVGAASFWAMKSFEAGETQWLVLSGQRAPIWQAAGRMFVDHVWVGVGPGNYSHAMVNDGYAATYLPGYPGAASGVLHAHNTPLQVFAETGVFGGLSFLAMFVVICHACWQVLDRGRVPFISLGILFMLIAFFVRSLTDNFLDLSLSADRIRVLFWLCLAAAVGLGRQRLDAPAESKGRSS